MWSSKSFGGGFDGKANAIKFMEGQKVVFAFAFFLSLVFAANAANAQPAEGSFFDGLTLGAGLSIFQGDVDSNPGNNPIIFLGNGGLHLLAELEKEVAGGAIGLSLTHDRFSGERSEVKFSSKAFGLAVTGSYPLPFIEPGFVRVFAGAGPLVLLPRFDRFQPLEGLEEKFEEKGPHVVAALPVGIIVQDRVRLGTRILLSDYVDGYEGFNALDFDLLTFINLGYRIRF